jgi:hypothetical protein
MPFSSNPDLRRLEFYQQFYDQPIQDLLRGRPNKSNDSRYEKVESIWNSLPKVSQFDRSIALIPSGWCCLLIRFLF